MLQYKVKELTPERCRQLRDNGIIKLLVHCLHSHTLQDKHNPPDQESLINEYLGKIQYRRNVSEIIQKIIENTAKSPYEIWIWKLLQILRQYVENLFLGNDKSSYTCFHPKDQMKILGQMSVKHKDIFQMLGVGYVVMDVMRAEYQFHKLKCLHGQYICLLGTILIGISQEDAVPDILQLCASPSFIHMLKDVYKAATEACTHKPDKSYCTCADTAINLIADIQGRR